MNSLLMFVIVLFMVLAVLDAHSYFRAVSSSLKIRMDYLFGFLMNKNK